MRKPEMLRMANQIAAFFGSFPHDEAVAGVAGHIRDFWDPRMRRVLAMQIEAGGEGLDPLVLEAGALLQADAA